MKKHIAKYMVFVRMAFHEVFAYRANFFLGLVATGITVLLSYYLWWAVYAGSEQIAGITAKQMVTYVIISGCIGGAVLYNVIPVFGELIQSGDFALELLRPINVPLIFLSRGISTFFVYAVVRGIPVLVTGALIAGIKWPETTLTLLYFLISLPMAFLISFLLTFIIAQLICLMQTYWSLARLWNVFIIFSTGQLIPLPFYPSWAKSCLFWLPFHSIFYTPIAIFLNGNIEIGGPARFLISYGFGIHTSLIAEQFAWVIILIPIMILTWKVFSRHMIIQGG